MLSQLSYTPILLVGLSGLEPPTSRLSGVRSNRLSYRPISAFRKSFLLSPSIYSLFSVLLCTLENEQCVSSSSTFLSLSLLNLLFVSSFLLRKEVIQPHLPIRLPCYDFTPIINPTFDCCPLAVSSQASGVIDSHGVTGGVYKARERIHRDILIRDY